MKIFAQKSISPFFSTIFLFMIISRLTWMQLRIYPIEITGLSQAFFIWVPNLEASSIRSWNINAIIALFILGPLSIRFLTGSWFMALLTATIIMSRGAMLARIGWLSFDLTVSLLITAWFCCQAHYFRTASQYSLLGSWLVLAIATGIEPSICLLSLVFPLYKFVLLLLRKNINLAAKNNQNYDAGNLFRTLNTNFETWLCSTHRSTERLSVGLAFFIILISLALSQKQPILSVTSHGFFHQPDILILDLHYRISILCIVLCAILSLRKQNHFYKFQLIFIGASCLWWVGAWCLHLYGIGTGSGLPILLWLEPMVLCFGSTSGLMLIGEIKDLLNLKKRVHN